MLNEPEVTRAGLHDIDPDQGCTCCQLATMALKIKTVTIPKRWSAWQKLSPSLGCQCIWAELHETGRLSATLAVKMLGYCRAARPSAADLTVPLTVDAINWVHTLHGDLPSLHLNTVDVQTETFLDTGLFVSLLNV